MMQLYLSYGGKLFVRATYRQGYTSVKAEDFQRLVDRIPCRQRPADWNEREFPKPRGSPLSWNNFDGVHRIDALTIRKRIDDDQQAREAEASTFYASALLHVGDGILMQVPEPVWRILEQPTGVWKIELDRGPSPRKAEYEFAVTSRRRAHEFITRVLGGRVDGVNVPHSLEKHALGGENDIVAVAQRIIQELDLNGEFSAQAAADSRELAILSADELVKRRPQWLAGSALPSNDQLRLRWLFEREKLDSEGWWLDYLASCSELDELPLA
ncbi:hypothetical protein DK26_01145 [Bosea sp. WAO]|nr:hypothetical protein DK26_01145 [Bosea sp. WAO]